MVTYILRTPYRQHNGRKVVLNHSLCPGDCFVISNQTWQASYILHHPNGTSEVFASLKGQHVGTK